MVGGNLAAARSLRERLLSVPLDGHAPDLAVDAFREALGAVVWAAHRMSRRGVGYAPEFLEQNGWSRRGIERLVTYVGGVDRTPFLYDPERPAADQRNRVQVLGTSDDAPPIARRVLATAGLERLHQIRVIVCDGPELLAWFGGFRDRPFTAEDEALLRRLVPALRTAFLWKRRLARADEAIVGLDAVMNALSCPAFIVRGGCRLEHVNTAGRPLADAHGRRLVTELVERVTAGEAERVAITGRGVSALELFVLRGASARGDAALARATERWRLTRRQREVLALVAAGDTNKSIATKLACAEVTVELHVTALLRKSGTTTRTELVSRLWSGE